LPRFFDVLQRARRAHLDAPRRATALIALERHRLAKLAASRLPQQPDCADTARADALATTRAQRFGNDDRAGTRINRHRARLRARVDARFFIARWTENRQEEITRLVLENADARERRVHQSFLFQRAVCFARATAGAFFGMDADDHVGFDVGDWRLEIGD